MQFVEPTAVRTSESVINWPADSPRSDRSALTVPTMVWLLRHSAAVFKARLTTYGSD